MAITSVKIHPAIGIARVGNSPDEFFIGPERLWDPPDPAGGFKDAQCRVKRQAARFRLFAYHDDGSVEEITATDAEISWTAHLVNKKMAYAGNPTIDAGTRTLDGPNQRAVFDSGTFTISPSTSVTVPLGEIRTDDTGHLLVLGGFGRSGSPVSSGLTGSYNLGWYDDVSDGPITARVTMTSTGTQFDAISSWVVVGPPKFAPQFDSVITLYDRLFEVGVAQGWLPDPADPSYIPSYTNDIYPILERARTSRWVVAVPGFAHDWTDPVLATADSTPIFDRLRRPGELTTPAGTMRDMPDLTQAALTAPQYAVMEKWKNEICIDDWTGVPTPAAITPAGLDRAALTSCVGASFGPGIEVGGRMSNFPILDPANFVGQGDPFRLTEEDPPGSFAGGITEYMALPWQEDFYACGGSWWPVARPDEVSPQAGGPDHGWDRDVANELEMVTKWHTLGFIVKQGEKYVEVDACDTTFINLLTSHIDFGDVPQGPMGMSRTTALAIAFEVRSPGAAVTFEVLPADRPSHSRLTVESSETVGPTTGNAIATVRLSLYYETGPLNESITDQLTVRAGMQSWGVTIAASTVARKVAAAALVLDRSGSMNQDRGDGHSKVQSLREAAAIFVDLMLEGDGVGIVHYNQDAQPLQGITALGDPGDSLDPPRQATKAIINGSELDPSGTTSIGDGIYEGRQLLLAPEADGHDVKALVVLTDGVENRSRYIADVAPEINELTYAIGFGTAQNTSAPALQTISGNNGGYLLVTGAITDENRFVLQKYFLQILAGISNAEVVLDPDGVLVDGQDLVIPFPLSDADTGVEVILLSPNVDNIDFRVQTPNGFVLEPWRANAEPSMTWMLSEGVSFYRFVLPTELVPDRYDQAGGWRILLSIGTPRTTTPDDVGDASPIDDITPTHGPSPSNAATSARRSAPFSVLVHTYSNLSLHVDAQQHGYEPGARVDLVATLTEFGLPARAGASVWAEITRPDSTTTTAELTEVEPGRFEGSWTTSRPGVHRARVRASGRTSKGYPYQREHTVTAAVWIGGDRDAEESAAGGGSDRGGLEDLGARFCGFLRCLLPPEIEQELERRGASPQRLLERVTAFCERSTDACDEDAPRRDDR